MNKTEKLAKAFKNGQTLTVKDIRKLGISNPTDAVFRLRKQGYCIYADKRNDGTTEYHLGVPNRRMVAFIYGQLGNSMYTEL